MAIDMKIIDDRISHLNKKKNAIKELLKIYGRNVENIGQNNKQQIQQFKLSSDTLKDIKVACVMDRFTLDSYAPECNLLEVTPKGWKSEIGSFKPDLLFIESSWQGKNGLWYRKIANGSKEFFEMASYCQEQNIPIVFWNKEDPVYTDTFMVVARMADVVFTTDIDCIKKYKDTLKHDNVFLLHFAAQPKVHNPIEKYDRKDKFCFAGAYYHRYKKRAEVFDKFSEIFIKDKGFDIYDRNYKNALPEHAFPSEYNPYILGKLDPSEIDIAYKGYNYGVNMNSIDQSQTMFARRVFEMLASNTVTVGNYSRGVKNFFGDLTICTNDDETLRQYLKRYCSDEITYRKYRLFGLRNVLSQHLYEDRFAYVIEKVFNEELKKKLPEIIAVGLANDLKELNIIVENFEKQTYENKKLYIVTEIKFDDISDKINIITAEAAKDISLDKFDAEDFITGISSSDYYGKNYLLDLALTTRYGDFKGIGKESYYTNVNGSFEINDMKSTYKFVNQLYTDRSIIKIKDFIEQTIFDFIGPKIVQGEQFFSIDEFNYCRNYSGTLCCVVDDMIVADQGISMLNIEKTAEHIKRDTLNCNGTSINAEEIIKSSKINLNSKVSYTINNGELEINSVLDENTHQYIYIEKLFEISDYEKDQKISLIFNGIGELDVTGVCVFYDINNNKISPAFTNMNRMLSADVPQKTKYIKLGLRPSGKGKFNLIDIVIGQDKDSNEKGCFISHSNVLVLSNHYPSSEELYKNMFVHKRMTSYKKSGYVFDVMRMNIYAKNEYREFEGINVIEGQSEVLANVLEKGNINTVCVHFLDSQMWGVLKNYLDKIRIIIWSHGADIQPWWRRIFNYNSEEELNAEKENSEIRMALWNDVFSKSKNSKMQFVYVSEYFAKEIMEDYKIQLLENKYSIIHNCIDTELFEYIPKDISQRSKILTIKPFASKKYANDLTTKAILELSTHKVFDELEFDIYGDGEYFERDNAPLRKYKNVHLNKTFLKQEDIFELHKTHGVFIATTRWDSHGVSRDEAMSSGLVPITNSVSAIPEFVDDDCGILIPEEDYLGVAKGIEKIYNEPEYFLKLSKNAAARVRRQTAKEFTIDKEIKLITYSNK